MAIKTNVLPEDKIDTQTWAPVWVLPVTNTQTETINPIETTQTAPQEPISQNNVWKIDTATWQEILAPQVEQNQVITPKTEVITPVPPIPQTTEWVLGFQEWQVVIPKVNTIDQTPEQIAKAKSDAINLEEQQKAIKIQESTNYTTWFSNLLTQWASEQDLTNYLKKNPTLYTENKAQLSTLYKNSITAKKNTDFVNTYGNQTNEQLLWAITSWTIVKWSNQYNLLSPEKRASFEQYEKEQQAVTDKANIPTWDVNSFNSILTEVKKIFSTDIKKEYTDLLNSPELKTLSSKSTDLVAQIKSIDDQLEYAREDAIAQNPQLAQNSFALNAAISDYKRGKIRERNSLVNEYTAVNSEIANKKADINTNLELSKYEDAQNKEAYQTALGLYETRRQETRADASAQASAEAKAIKEEKDMAFEAQKIEFEAQNKALAEDVKFERDLVLIDYKNKIESEKIKWEWLKRDDWLYFAKSDWTIEKVLETDIVPWVKSDIVFDNWQPYVEVYDINNNWVWFTTTNTQLKWQALDLLNAPNGTRIPTRLNKADLSPNNPWWKECWEYVNDIVSDIVWSRIWSLWSDKTAYANETNWKVWSVAVWQVNPNDTEMSKYWHTGIIVWETTNWDEWIIKSSNIKWQWVVSTVRVPKSVIDWYKTTNIIWTEKVLNTAQTEFLNKIDASEFASNKNIKETALELWLNANDIYNFKSANLPTLKKEDYKTALDKIDLMMNAWWWDWFSDAIWLYSWARSTSDSWEISFDAWTDAADFKAQFDSLISSLTLPNLDKMSWVLTDKDIELLKSAWTALNLKMSETEFKNTVNELKWVLNRALNWVPLPEWDIIFTDTDWVKYDKNSLSKEIERAINAWELTVAQAKQFIADNKLNLN